MSSSGVLMGILGYVDAHIALFGLDLMATFGSDLTFLKRGFRLIN